MSRELFHLEVKLRFYRERERGKQIHAKDIRKPCRSLHTGRVSRHRASVRG